MKATLSWKLWNFKDTVQFQTTVLAVKIDEPPTKKIRDCGAKETQLSLILVIVASCWLVDHLFFNMETRASRSWKIWARLEGKSSGDIEHAGSLESTKET